MSLRPFLLGCAVIMLGCPVIAAEPPAASPPVAVSAPAPDPAKIVAYRQSIMGAAGKRMKAASMVVKGDIPRPQDLPAHAAALHDLGVGLTDLFPPGTDPSKVKTEAKPEVWSDFEKFKAAAQAYETESQKLVDISKTNDLAAYQQQFGVVGKACGSCHDGFRVKD
jgi:cytochrome c556